MKTNNSKIHIIAGTVICAATMLLFLLFNSQLPNNVPVQITFNGSIGNTLPKPLLVFGLPIIFSGINLVKGFSYARKEKTSVVNFYIIPGIAILLSTVILWTALNM